METPTLVLLGRNGNGKSSTGNSILGTRTFSPRNSSSSSDDEVGVGTTDLDGRTLCVIDGPGLDQADTIKPDNVEAAFGQVEKVLELCPLGFICLVLVLKYGTRFTKQEKDTIDLIKSIFGQHIFQEFGVIVMTYGDSFDLDMEFEAISFKTWCSNQEGDIQQLFQEFKHRCVLFNNRTTDRKTQLAQRRELLGLVEKLAHEHQPYTKKDYELASPSRDRLVLVSKIPALKEDIDHKLNIIEDQLNKVEKISSIESQLDQLRKLLLKVEGYKTDLTSTDKGAGLLKHLFVGVDVMAMKINGKIKLAENEKGIAITYPKHTSLKPEINESPIVSIKDNIVYIVGVIIRFIRTLWRHFFA